MRPNRQQVLRKVALQCAKILHSNLFNSSLNLSESEFTVYMRRNRQQISRKVALQWAAIFYICSC